MGTRANAAIVGLLALVGITGASGGLEEAEPEGFITASAPEGIHAVEQPIEMTVAPFDIVIDRTYEVDAARVVEMQLTNTESRPIPAYDLLVAFRLEDSNRDEEEQPKFVKSIVRMEEPGPLTELPAGRDVTLNPGVPMNVALVFTDPPAQEENALRATEADRLSIWSLEYRESFLDGSMAWLLGELTAEVDLA